MVEALTPFRILRARERNVLIARVEGGDVGGNVCEGGEVCLKCRWCFNSKGNCLSWYFTVILKFDFILFIFMPIFLVQRDVLAVFIKKRVEFVIIL